MLILGNKLHIRYITREKEGYFTKINESKKDQEKVIIINVYVPHNRAS